VVVRVVRTAETNGGDVELRFTVADTGIGIGHGERDRLFQVFTQADSSMTRRYGGTGLGLAISRQLVELMHGSIGVESEPGVGSTFWFTVRLAESDAAPARETVTDLRGVRVLVVDDNETNRRIVTHLLRRREMVVETAAGGSDALAALRAASARHAPFILAVLDLQMPEMDGLELARAIKADPVLQQTRLVLLSSLGHIGSEAAASQAGIAATAVKPVREARLYECVRAALDSSVEAPSVVKRTERKHAEQRATRPGRLLVAEDNVINQLVATRLLQKLGYRTDVVANGLEAVEALHHTRYRLVLMDCQMPELDGLAATEVIRREEGSDRHTPIIAMTANAMAGDRDQCLAAGMDDYISKPVRLEDLDRVLAQWIPESLSDRG
jgi:CheY-like chemotaxis protein